MKVSRNDKGEEVLEIDIDNLTVLDMKLYFNNPRLERMLQEVQKLSKQEIIVQDLIRKLETKDNFRVAKTGGKGYVIIMITDKLDGNKRYKFKY